MTRVYRFRRRPIFIAHDALGGRRSRRLRLFLRPLVSAFWCSEIRCLRMVSFSAWRISRAPCFPSLAVGPAPRLKSPRTRNFLCACRAFIANQISCPGRCFISFRPFGFRPGAGRPFGPASTGTKGSRKTSQETKRRPPMANALGYVTETKAGFEGTLAMTRPYGANAPSPNERGRL